MEPFFSLHHAFQFKLPYVLIWLILEFVSDHSRNVHYIRVAIKILPAKVLVALCELRKLLLHLLEDNLCYFRA